MNELVACCGLDCGHCEARLASINNDDVEKKSSGNNSQDSTTGGLKMN